MDRIFVVLADPSRSLYDKDSKMKFAGNYVRQISTEPYPSQKIKEWLAAGALLEVKAEDVIFFYTTAELNQMKKEQIVSIAKDWDLSLFDAEGKEKSRAQLIEELSVKLGEG